jgi:hypothetical protein
MRHIASSNVDGSTVQDISSTDAFARPCVRSRNCELMNRSLGPITAVVTTFSAKRRT